MAIMSTSSSSSSSKTEPDARRNYLQLMGKILKTTARTRSAKNTLQQRYATLPADVQFDLFYQGAILSQESNKEIRLLRDQMEILRKQVESTIGEVGATSKQNQAVNQTSVVVKSEPCSPKSSPPGGCISQVKRAEQKSDEVKKKVEVTIIKQELIENDDNDVNFVKAIKGTTKRKTQPTDEETFHKRGDRCVQEKEENSKRVTSGRKRKSDVSTEDGEVYTDNHKRGRKTAARVLPPSRESSSDSSPSCSAESSCEEPTQWRSARQANHLTPAAHRAVSILTNFRNNIRKLARGGATDLEIHEKLVADYARKSDGVRKIINYKYGSSELEEEETNYSRGESDYFRQHSGDLRQKLVRPDQTKYRFYQHSHHHRSNNRSPDSGYNSSTSSSGYSSSSSSSSTTTNSSSNNFYETSGYHHHYHRKWKPSRHWTE